LIENDIADLMRQLVINYGYLGVFLGVLASNSTILVPIPGVFLVFLGGTFLNPALVGLSAGLGGALGEMTSYLCGRAGRRLIGRDSEIIAGRRLYERFGLGIVYLFSAAPLPFDIIGIICGMLKVDPRKFLVVTFLGKSTQYTLYAYSGFQAWEIATSIWTRHLSYSAVVFLLTAGAFTALILWFWRNQVRKEAIPQSTGRSGNA